MELDELIALMAASIFATDESRDGGFREDAAKRAVEHAEMIWRVVDRKNP